MLFRRPQSSVDYQKTVLTAWKEIDEALTAYAAEQQQHRALQQRKESAHQAYTLLQARHRRGMSSFSDVLDSQRAWLQAPATKPPQEAV